MICWARQFHCAWRRDRLRVSQASCSAPSTCASLAVTSAQDGLEAVAAGLVAAILAGIENIDLGEIAEAHRPVRGHRAEPRQHRTANGEILVPGLERHRAAGAEQLRRGAVGIDVLHPIVGDLVIVEGVEEGMGGVGALQVRIRLVERVALSIVAEVEGFLTDALPVRRDQACRSGSAGTASPRYS